MNFEELENLMELFEKRNNMSITFCFHSDGSFSIEEFHDNEFLFWGTKDFDMLKLFLIETQYELDEDGLCNSPTVIDKMNPKVMAILKKN